MLNFSKNFFHFPNSLFFAFPATNLINSRNVSLEVAEDVEERLQRLIGSLNVLTARLRMPVPTNHQLDGFQQMIDHLRVVGPGFLEKWIIYRKFSKKFPLNFFLQNSSESILIFRNFEN